MLYMNHLKKPLLAFRNHRIDTLTSVKKDSTPLPKVESVEEFIKIRQTQEKEKEAERIENEIMK